MSETYYHNIHKVEQIRHLTESTFIVRIERKDLPFTPGQHLVVGRRGEGEFRQYSILSGISDPFFEILVKEVEDGTVSPKLKKLKPGDEVEINGPMGYFTLSKTQRSVHPLVFIATGTGIAPFNSFVNSYNDLNYKVIHGVRTSNESYAKDSFQKNRFVLCTSREQGENFNGRVTEYLKKAYFPKETLFYLCGNSEMIFDSMEILKEKGLNPNYMFAEVYF